MKKNTIKKAMMLCLLGIFLLPTYSKAQQDAQYSHYTYNLLAVNSAYASSKNAINVVLLSRNQWVGLDGAPRTNSLTLMSPIFKNMLGLGLSYVRDKIGPTTVDNVFVDVAYKIKLHEGGYLGMGIKAGIDIKKADLTSLNPLEQNDMSYMNDLQSKLTPNFGAGLFYYNRKFYVGISTPKLNQSDLSVDNTGTKMGVDEVRRHYFVVAGYVFTLNDDWKYKPSVLTKFVKSAPPAFDLSSSFLFRDRIAMGLAYRFAIGKAKVNNVSNLNGDSFGANIQVRTIGNLWLGYAYEMGISKLSRLTGGTHEILLALDLSIKKDDIIKSPRFF